MAAYYLGTNHPRLTLGSARSPELSKQPEQLLSKQVYVEGRGRYGELAV
jgi:hypothetical protein